MTLSSLLLLSDAAHSSAPGNRRCACICRSRTCHWASAHLQPHRCAEGAAAVHRLLLLLLLLHALDSHPGLQLQLIASRL
jgi:hypothetical protein